MTDYARPATSKNLPPDVYAIPEANLHTLLKRLSALQKRATVLGLAPITVEQVGQEFRMLRRPTTLDGFDRPAEMRRFVHVRVSGETPKIAGWQFVAALDHLTVEGTDGYENIVRTIPTAGQPAPEFYRTAPPRCDHCGTIRQRAKTYVLVGVNGEWKQVGSDCLRDFLGHADPHAIASLLEHLFDVLRDGQEELDEDRGHGVDYIRLSDLLPKAAASVRIDGWVSRKTAQEHERMISTADAVSSDWYRSDGKPTDLPVTPEDVEEAKSAIAWAIALGEKAEPSDYEHNLNVIGRVGYITRRHWALAISMVAGYRRSLGLALFKEHEPRKPSTYQGAVGERITRTVSVLKAVATESEWGRGTLFVLSDEDGNDYVWHSSRIVDLQEGQKATLTGTVKQHSEYNGRQQTRLTRAKIVGGPWNPEPAVAETQEVK